MLINNNFMFQKSTPHSSTGDTSIKKDDKIAKIKVFKFFYRYHYCNLYFSFLLLYIVMIIVEKILGFESRSINK